MNLEIIHFSFSFEESVIILMNHYNTLSGQHQDHIMTEKEIIELSDLIGVTSPYYLRAVQ